MNNPSATLCTIFSTSLPPSSAFIHDQEGLGIAKKCRQFPFEVRELNRLV